MPDQLPAASDWTLLLDRLEERLRLIEAAAVVLPGMPPTELGPAPASGDLPVDLPSEPERLRLLALAAAHDRLEDRLNRRRRQLRQAQHYSVGAA